MGVDAALEDKIISESDEAALIGAGDQDDVRFCLQRNRIYAYGAVASHKLAKRPTTCAFAFCHSDPMAKRKLPLSMKAISRYVSILSSFRPA